MPRIRYSVAMSLDGYIAGPRGEVDWIIMNPDIDFGTLFAQFDTFLMGRRTFEGMSGAQGPGMSGGRNPDADHRSRWQGAQSGAGRGGPVRLGSGENE